MRRRHALPAFCAALVLVIGQLIALAHHAETRHVTCGEHGEELEAPELAQSLHDCDDDHLVGLDNDGGEHHEDCLVLRSLHQSSSAPDAVSPPLLFVVTTDLVRPAPPVSVASVRALYRLAPKTSPPIHV